MSISRLLAPTLLSATLALALPGCAIEDNDEASQVDSSEESEPIENADPLLAPLPDPSAQPRPGDEDVAAAADEFAVPPPLLHSLVGPTDVTPLRGEALATGARLIGEDVALVQYDRRASIRAAAALLSNHADELEIDRSQWSAWSAVLARYGAAAGTP